MKRPRKPPVALDTVICLYDPLNLDAPAKPVPPQFQPATFADQVEMVREYNRIAAERPKLLEVIGIFRQSELAADAPRVCRRR